MLNKEGPGAGETGKTGDHLPRPSGYHLLCAIPDAEATYGDSGIVKPDSAKATEELTTVVLFVLRMGPDAYRDEKKFPFGPWCKEGDFILTRPYAGTRVRVHGKEFRLIADDQVEAVVDDPRGLFRA